MRGRLARRVPLVGSIASYERAWLSKDLVAGVSVTALLVPQSIAYASIGGVPPQIGLYAALGGLVGYALFGSSRQVVTGPSATVAAVSFSVVSLLASAGSPNFVAYSAVLALAAAVVYIALGALKMGWIANFLSTAVLGGFVFAFGIGLIIDQSHKLLGVPGGDGTYMQKLWSTLKQLPDTSGTTLAVGLGALALLLVLRRFAPTWPRALIAVVLGIAVSSLLDLTTHGVAIVGHVPTGLPSVGVPHFAWSDLPTLLVGGLAVIFVGFSESLASAREAASRHGYEIDVSQEMVAQGAANGAAGLLGAFAVDGSLSKTAVADLAGQRTQLASLFTAGFIVLTLLFLAGVFEALPDAVLGAVVIDAALGLIKVPQLKRFRATSLTDFAAYVAAGLGLLFVGVLAGIVIGVVLSLLLLVAVASRSPVRQLGLDPVHNVYVDTERHPEALVPEGIVVARLDGPLFFADASNFRAAVLDLVARSEPRALVIDLEAAATIDLDGADVLAKLDRELAGREVVVGLAHVHGDQLELLRKAGALEAIGAERLFPSVREAVAALSDDAAGGAG
jgi:SulP family sulfate permease